MTAVMGPSGSGKTTFMTTIAGKAYYGRMTGEILINDNPNLAVYKFKNSTGFVPQEDIMLREMTVEETLLFAAKTRLPKTMTKAEKIEIVEDVLEILDLKAIRFSRIGDENVRGISGGQRKRVNIGIELVSDPTLLFLDEPTSGLDSSSSMSICNALRKISSIGLTIVAVIHQPRYEIFELFHDVLLLAKGGRTVYQGPTEEALDYFESLGYKCPVHVNPADFLIDIISEQQAKENGEFLSADELVSKWKTKQNEKIEENEPKEDEILYSDLSSSGSSYLQGNINDDDDNYEEINPSEIHTELDPITLQDVKKKLKKIYYKIKEELVKQVPSLAMTKEELFSIESGESIKDEMYSFDNLGTKKTFLITFISCIILPIFIVPIAFFKLPFEKTRPSLSRQYGGIFAMFFLFFILQAVYFFRFIIILSENSGIYGVGYCGVLIFCFIPSIVMFLAFIKFFKFSRQEQKPIPFFKEFVGGFMGWLFYVGATWNSNDTSIPNRMMKMIGFLFSGYFVLMLTSAILLTYPPDDLDTCTNCKTALPFLPETLSIAIFYFFVAFLLARRMHVLPLNLRAKPSFFYQLIQITKRSFIQITRNWIIYVFDLLLVINAGVFVGIIYYQQYYEPPIIQKFPNQTCPDFNLPDNVTDTVCKLLTIPQSDPLSGQASITCLALALAAVASSLRIFGDETVTFRRESTSGLSTEAYCKFF